MVGVFPGFKLKVNIPTRREERERGAEKKKERETEIDLTFYSNSCKTPFFRRDHGWKCTLN